jgi:hypothetical protein
MKLARLGDVSTAIVDVVQKSILTSKLLLAVMLILVFITRTNI